MLKAAGKIYLRRVMPKYQDILRKEMALRENNVIQVSKIGMAEKKVEKIPQLLVPLLLPVTGQMERSKANLSDNNLYLENIM